MSGGAAAGMLLQITHGAVWGWRTEPQFDDDAIALWGAVLDAAGRRPLSRGAGPRRSRPGRRAPLRARELGPSVRLVDAAVARLQAALPTPQDAGRRAAAGQQLALARPELLPRRRGAGRRARRAGDAGWATSPPSPGAHPAGRDRAELGRLDEAHSDLLRARQLAERHPLPQELLISGWGLALLRQAHGDLAGAEDDVVRLEGLEHTLATPGDGIGLASGVDPWAQGRLAECEPVAARGRRVPADRTARAARPGAGRGRATPTRRAGCSARGASSRR